MGKKKKKNAPGTPGGSDWEEKVQEHSQDLPPIPGAAPPEEPQVEEVVEDEREI